MSQGSNARRPDVQGLRAVAVLLVVAYHSGMPVPGGFVGVDIFFVISGFVITGMLHREWEAHGQIRFGRFYLRRIKRLTPALALMVSVAALLSTLFLSPFGAQQTTAQTGVGAMFIVANAVIARTTGDYFDAPAETNALLHTWSLSVEEQFYLVFPVVLAVSWWVARRRAWSTRRLSSVVVALVVAFSLSIAVLLSRGFELHAGEMLVGFYGPLTRVWEFGVGALLALVPWVSGARFRTGRWSGPVFAAAGGLLLVASVSLISSRTPFPGAWTLLPVAGTVLLIIAGGARDHAGTRFLGARPMVTVGDWSYSIYLWHWPFIVFAGALWPHQPATLVIAALLSLLPAIASYTYFEEPIRNMQVQGVVAVGRLVALTVVPAVVLALALGSAVQHGFWSSTVRASQAAVLDGHRGCHSYTPLSDETTQLCTWNATGTGVPIYLVGDSHAKHFSEAVIGAGEELGRPVVVSTASGCPFVDVHLSELAAPPTQDGQCRSYVQGTMSHLRAATPGVVVLAASDLYWTDADHAAGLTDSGLTNRSAAKLAIAPVVLTATVRALEGAGHKVLLVDDVPRWSGSDEWTPADCTLISIITGFGSCAQEMPLERVEVRQGSVRAVLKEVATATGAGLLDPWERLCADGVCPTHGEGGSRYRDTNHITVLQSAAFAPDFVRAIDLIEGS
ncbi:MAG: acyltransferase family protein [Knoellia sp.]